MEKLIEGVRYFQTHVFESERAKFESLAKGQHPSVLLVVCSDSRINPHLFTQTKSGDLFVMRNAGNIVPAHGASNGGEEATVEYAVMVLKVRHIVICGHSHCGAMHGLLEPESLETLPAVANWLTHADATRQIMTDKYPQPTGADRLMQAVQENVLAQMNNLRTYPSVSSKLALGELDIHGWVYEFETGKVLTYEKETDRFVPLFEDQRLTPAASA